MFANEQEMTAYQLSENKNKDSKTSIILYQPRK